MEVNQQLIPFKHVPTPFVKHKCLEEPFVKNKCLGESIVKLALTHISFRAIEEGSCLGIYLFD